MCRGKPFSEVVNDSRKKSCFSDAEEKSKCVEVNRCPHEAHRRCDDSPRDDDSRDPASRANANQNEIARNLEDGVAEKKYSGTQAECCRAELQVAVHLQTCERDIRAVEKIEEVENEQERDEAQTHLSHHLTLDFCLLP